MSDPPAHYSFVTRMLLKLLQENRLRNVASVEVEPEYGYATRIVYRDGSVRMTLGNDVGLNPSGATDVAKDKAHTKFFLRSSKIACPRGSTFVLPWWAERIGPRLELHEADPMRLPSDAPAYVANCLGFPVFVKPVDGSQGHGVHRCSGRAELISALESLNSERARVAIVEEDVALPDFRIVVLDGQVISAYLRDPLAVVGDGHSTIEALVRDLGDEFRRQGRVFKIEASDERVRRTLQGRGTTADSRAGRKGSAPAPVKPLTRRQGA
jgi:biotin carboxylase